MNIHAYGLGGNQSQLDKVIQETSGRETSAHLDIVATLSVSGIKRHAKRVNRISDTEVEITLTRDITASKVLRMLKASDSNIYDIEYDEEIDNNDLINVTSKPLWSLNKSGNVLRLNRVK